MKLKKLHLPLLAFAVCMFNFASAQLFIDNAQFFIQGTGTVTVQGDVTSNVDIQGTGKIILKGTANQNVNMNGFTIPNLEIDNTANTTLTGNARIGTNLLFTNGEVQLGNFNLRMASAATFTGPGNNKYIVTNGTGRLVKEGLAASAFVYPVGNSTTTYNPVTISNAGTSDAIGVRVLANAFTTGTTGSAISKEVVDASWDLSEDVAGGSNLSVTATWDAADELPGLNRLAGTGIGLSNYLTTPAPSVGWDLLNSQTGAASGTNPYTITRSGITTVGAFAVGRRPVLSPLLVAAKVFLQGNYNTGTGVMSEGLRTGNRIPTTEPYTGMSNFTHLGSGGGETSTAAIVGSGATSNNDAITDWVFLQLHQTSDGAIISTRSALLQRDGDVVDTDGVSPLSFAGNAAGNYFVSVRHRNHLGVRSNASLALAKTTATAFNTTNDLAGMYSTGITNPALATLTTGIFGLYGGNANSDRATRKTGSAGTNDYSIFLVSAGSVAAPGPTGVYNREDFNMDGNVRKTGSATTNDYSRLLAILGALNIINQPVF
ncbi:MAG: hypothetical protein ACOYKE_07850 [Ferruginibacter sp.]